jgi:hypothetical protein
MAFTEADIRGMVTDWYQALDRHDDAADILYLLVNDGLEMRFPEMTARGHAGFHDWYKAVTHRYFDEVHAVTSVEFTEVTADRADLKVIVNWQARIWTPPAAKSQWLGFDAYQTWVVVAGKGGAPQLKTYIVDALEPMPGSAPL